MAFATAHIAGMNGLVRPSCTPFPQRSIRSSLTRRSSLVVRAAKDNLREEVQGAPGVKVPDNGEQDSYE